MADFSALRSLAIDLVYEFAPNAVAATVTRPVPDSTPIEATGIWDRPLEEDQPFGSVLKKREPRKVLVLRRSVVPTLPNGTTVVAPETRGGVSKTWRVDGLALATDQDHFRAILIPA